MKKDRPVYSGRTPSVPFEQICKLVKEQGVFFPPIDGHELFGFTSGLFHKLVMNAPGIDNCRDYQRRYFRTTFIFTDKWPGLGNYSPLGPPPDLVVPEELRPHSPLLPVVNFPELRIDFGPLWRRESTYLLLLGPVIEPIGEPRKMIDYFVEMAELRRQQKKESEPRPSPEKED
jgi:hypothetical protein